MAHTPSLISAHNSSIFPNEILLLIKEMIPIYDLRTHVCYYHVCRTIAGFYGDEANQAEFWRKACLRSGICFTRYDSSYRDVAFEVIKADGFCTHPDCGGNLLRRNARSVRNAMKRFHWDPEDDNFDEEDRLNRYISNMAAVPGPRMNRIFSKLAFGDNLPRWWLPQQPYEYLLQHGTISPYLSNSYPVFLRRLYPGPSLTDSINSIALRRVERHPLVWRSMATFPSMIGFYCSLGLSERPLCLVTGVPLVSVSDTICALSYWFDEKLTVEELAGLLMNKFKHLCQNQHAISLLDLYRFKTLRGLLTRCRLTDFSFMPEMHQDPGLSFMLNFDLKPETENDSESEASDEDASQEDIAV